MELRVHGEAGAVKSPTGWIPTYEDLKPLFKQVLDKDYAPADYVKQFTIRVPENLGKLDRVEAFHRTNVPGAPEAVFTVLAAQRERLLQAQARHGDYISPMDLQ
jgi:phosphoenolpyruvate carboxykinase (GTP)